MASPATVSARQRHNILSRHRGPDNPATLDALRELRAHRLEDHIREVITNAPALTAEQVERLRALLPPANANNGDAT